MNDKSLPNWRQSLAASVSNVEALASILELPKDWIMQQTVLVEKFPLLVPHSFINRMRRGDVNDPLLRQVLPLSLELNSQNGTSLDAVGDLNAKRAPGLLHKYPGRALLITTGACAVHCRYCFRRHYPYASEPKKISDFEEAFKYLEQDNSIFEVILSGGDPLLIHDHTLSAIAKRLESISHIEILRIHSRLPVVLPERITDELLNTLKQTRLQKIMVIHANHPNEVVDDCADALRRIVNSGIPTLNQSVLLKGINDSAEVLTDLSRALIRCGVKPYYLHQLDRVAGVLHFEVEDSVALSLVETLRNTLPGYLVPRLVREIAGESSKSPLD